MGKNVFEKHIIVYNNSTGIVKKIAPLCDEERIDVMVVRDEKELIKTLSGKAIQLILVDIELDSLGLGQGMDLLTSLRLKSYTPIIVVSNQRAEIAKIKAFNAGADDYVTSDCNPLELMARIKSQISRYRQLSSIGEAVRTVYRVDQLEIDDATRKVSVEGREVKLTPIEYKILRLLVMEQGRVLSISQIYERIWKMQAIGADNTIAVHIRHIREKIEHNPANPRYLKVVRGSGYKVG